MIVRFDSVNRPAVINVFKFSISESVEAAILIWGVKSNIPCSYHFEPMPKSSLFLLIPSNTNQPIALGNPQLSHPSWVGIREH